MLMKSADSPPMAGRSDDPVAGTKNYPPICCMYIRFGLFKILPPQREVPTILENQVSELPHFSTALRQQHAGDTLHYSVEVAQQR